MNRNLATVLAYAASGPPDVQAAAKELQPKKRSRKVLSLPGKTKAQRDEIEDALYEGAKAGAFARAGLILDTEGEVVRSARCEWHTDGVRCGNFGDDPHHVVGGSHKKECERLGAEGLEILCRQHHDLATANLPTRAACLDQAKAHALRHGYRRLLAIVERAITRDESKHPRARSSGGGTTP